MHILSTRHCAEFAAVPDLVRFTLAESMISSRQEPTVLIKSSTVMLKYILRLKNFQLILGPVDKPDPEADASERDEAEEAGGGLVISGGDAPLFLEMRNEALNA
jgi:hypothetical protein